MSIEGVCAHNFAKKKEKNSTLKEMKGDLKGWNTESKKSNKT